MYSVFSGLARRRCICIDIDKIPEILRFDAADNPVCIGWREKLNCNQSLFVAAATVSSRCGPGLDPNRARIGSVRAQAGISIDRDRMR